MPSGHQPAQPGATGRSPAAQPSRPPLPRGTDDPSRDVNDSAEWCVPADQLQELVSFLASPGVLPTIAQLALAPCRYDELRQTLQLTPADLDTVLTGLIDQGIVDTVLTGLIDEGIVEISHAGGGRRDAWYQLSEDGRELLQPLAAFAAWYRENSDELTATDN